MDLHNVNIEYLQALIDDDDKIIAKFEERARERGYGPLAPCTWIGEIRQTREMCGTSGAIRHFYLIY